MTSSPSPAHDEHEEFSLPLFAATVVVSLASLLGLIYFVAPDTWAAQFNASPWQWVVAFVGISLVNAFFEFFFHRYLLHTPAIPFLTRLYRQHTLHHALTHIIKRPSRDGRSVLVVENKFPIVEPEQGEASFFPWYSLVVFAAVLSPILIGLQWLFPTFPWLVAGLGALTVSLCLYEILHALNHWPFPTWEPLIFHKTWGWFWRPVYSFHVRHHAVIDCNESISGFFGLPVADWAFGTCIIPQTVYADGEAWSPEKFTSPKPRWFIVLLDRWSQRMVQKRRAKAQEAQSEKSAPLGASTEEN